METHLGSVAYALPKHGSDYIFGPEHMRTWKSLQKKRSANSLKPDVIATPTGAPIGPMTKEKEQEMIDKGLTVTHRGNKGYKCVTKIESDGSETGSCGYKRMGEFDTWHDYEETPAPVKAPTPPSREASTSTNKASPDKLVKKGYKPEDGDWVDGKWYPHY